MQTCQVFVSHTSDMAQFPEDRSFVQAALDAVSRAGMAPVDMRYFAARDGKPADYCRQRVAECEIYVAVIGFRYGTMAPGEAVSYTELEFDEASMAGQQRLVFLLADTVDLPAGLADADRTEVAGFRQRLRDAGLVVRRFTSAADLELEVFHALTEATGGTPAVHGTVPSAREVRYSLPPDTAAFTGRDEELGIITSAAGYAEATGVGSGAAGGGTAGAGGVVAIHAIDGMPGVGKTALAVHVAHLLRARFPDRQLFIDLCAHTPGQDPVAPKAALGELLTAVGVDARYLPEDLAGRAALWRDRMAGQHALLVLDNAASSAQVAPLLPAGAGCLVLVTSRRHLGDLPGAVVPVQVEALPPDQAQAMFLRLAPSAATGPASAVPELVGLAGCLPLAISLLARVYARHPSWSLADLARETRASMLTMAAEQDSVAGAFEVSYRYLAPGHQQFFRRLGLHPGTTYDACSAAALGGIGLPEADGHLDALHGEGLLTEVGYRRYGMHDLIRRYALDRAATDPAANRDQALERLLDYYQHTAAITEAHLARQSRTTPAWAILAALPDSVPDLPDRTRALSWARAERANLLACLDHATRTGLHARVVALTAAMAALLRQDGPWADAMTRHASAVQAAQKLGDRPAEASARNELGDVQRLTGDYRSAREALEEALAICCDLGDRQGQANALSNLGVVRRLTGDGPGAAEAQEEVLGICRDLGDRLGQRNAFTELGAMRPLRGDYRGAADALAEALSICRDLGDRLGQGTALTYLAVVRRLTGDYRGAADALAEALNICRDLGDRLGQGNALNCLGVVRRMTGDYRGAADALEAALDIYRDLGDRLGQGNALNCLGVVRRMTGDYRGAADALVGALEICDDLGDRQGAANALSNLGVVRRLKADYQGATEALEAALGSYRSLDDRGGEVEATNEMGTLHRVRGYLDRAQACHRKALDLAREIDSSWDEAHALAGLGRCALAVGDTTSAKASLRQAGEIFQRIGAAEAKDVAAELDALADL
jgi:tetratricopeptide (TPR) repeat protein